MWRNDDTVIACDLPLSTILLCYRISIYLLLCYLHTLCAKRRIIIIIYYYYIFYRNIIAYIIVNKIYYILQERETEILRNIRYRLIVAINSFSYNILESPWPDFSKTDSSGVDRRVTDVKSSAAESYWVFMSTIKYCSRYI